MRGRAGPEPASYRPPQGQETHPQGRNLLKIPALASDIAIQAPGVGRPTQPPRARSGVFLSPHEIDHDVREADRHRRDRNPLHTWRDVLSAADVLSTSLQVCNGLR